MLKYENKKYKLSKNSRYSFKNELKNIASSGPPRLRTDTLTLVMDGGERPNG